MQPEQYKLESFKPKENFSSLQSFQTSVPQNPNYKKPYNFSAIPDKLKKSHSLGNIAINNRS